MLPIITVPDHRLRMVSKPVAKIDKKVLSFITELAESLVKKSDPPGVGLSAIQVAKPWRIFLTQLPEDKSLPMDQWTPDTLRLEVFINPEIVTTSQKTTLGGTKGNPTLEGCLSIPRVWGPVWRHQWVKVKYQTFEIKKISAIESGLQIFKVTTKFSGFAARVVQHEHDHLNGVLFTDYSLQDNLPLYEEQGGEMSPISL